ncbi:hypothetical protein FNV43_RR02440 [Rhamnella rubrinervis]|uniref:Uncharacterized protein n=1 Tax=Rhamnella rubrinervis TaxID=2594499 RepID=A0A8K0HS90_9ROSA|nr:hypothetical protein FNV43_RR02440 [Rhamnella rubrinervis]
MYSSRARSNGYHHNHQLGDRRLVMSQRERVLFCAGSRSRDFREDHGGGAGLRFLSTSNRNSSRRGRLVRTSIWPISTPTLTSLKHVDCYSITIWELEYVTSRFKFNSMLRAPVHGFAFWFDVEFSGAAASPMDDHAIPLHNENQPMDGTLTKKRLNPNEVSEGPPSTLATVRKESVTL